MDAVFSQLWLLPFMLARVLAFFRALPFMATESLPPLLVTAAGGSLVPLFWPLAAQGCPENAPPLTITLALLLKEAGLGFALGFSAALLFHAVMGAGFLLDNQRGASQGDVTDPSSQEQTSPVGALFFQWTTALLCSLGALPIFLVAFVESYVWWPVFSPCPPSGTEALYAFTLGQMNAFFHMLLALAAPIAALYFLSDFALGLVNRFAPQLNVFVLSMPVKSGLMLFLLLLYLPALYHILTGEIARLPSIFTALNGAWHE